MNDRRHRRHRFWAVAIISRRARFRRFVPPTRPQASGKWFMMSEMSKELPVRDSKVKAKCGRQGQPRWIVQGDDGGELPVGSRADGELPAD